MMINKWLKYLLFFVCYLLIIAKPVFGFRADDDNPAAGNKEAAKTTAANTQATLPTDQQNQIVKDLEKKGISIQWDNQFGSPVSVRGKGVGAVPLGGRRTAASVFSGTYGQRSVAVLNNLGPLYGIQDAAQEIKPSGAEQMDHLGFRHQKMKQIYRGIPVVGGDLNVHFDGTGSPYQVTGRFVPAIRLDPKPSILPEQAVAVAVEDFLKRGFAGPKIEENAQLVIFALTKPPQLAYQLVISDNPLRRYRYWISASNGKIIQAINLVCSIVPPPSSQGQSTPLQGLILAGEGGKVMTFSGWKENQVFYMYDPANFYYVFNNADSADWPPASISNQAYLDAGTYAHRATSNWGGSDPNEVSIAVNTAYVMSYFKAVHNRNSADGRGTVVPAVAHFDVNLVNAYWNQSAMFFGDGDGITANCLATLDICGHELAHGVTQYSADLIYQNESGALNESFSDIFGANIEFQFQTDNRAAYPNKSAGTADWLMGEDCWLSSPALRDMRNPANTATVGAGGRQPSRYKGTFWYSGSGDNGGVHYNSGVQNFFYYLLCDGGSGANDGISYNVNGIGIQNARQLAYRALTVYCTPSTDYKAVRRAWISAAQDLNPSWVSSVEAAWDAVGVVQPRIISPLSIETVVNHPMVPYTIRATDSPKSFQVSGMPAGLNLKGAIISGVPTTQGTFAATLIVTTLSDVITETLTIKVNEPAPFDDFAQAKLLVLGPNLPISTSGANRGFSRETGEPVHGTGGPATSVWFKWIADKSGSITFSTAGSNFDTVLAVYTGSSLGNLTKIAANNDFAPNDKTSRVQFLAKAGQTYYLALDGARGESGDYTLTATGSLLSPPSNDNFVSSANLGSSQTFRMTNSILHATAEAGEPALAGLQPTRSVWFSWTAPALGNLSLHTGGSDFANVLGIYSGTNFATLKLLQGKASAAMATNPITVPVVAGNKYVIKVDGARSTNGTYRLTGQLATLSAPAGVTFTNLSTSNRQVSPRIAWSPVAGASHYQVEILRTNTLLRGITVKAPSTNWNNGPTLPRTNGFSARVRAFSNNLASDWTTAPAVFP